MKKGILLLLTLVPVAVGYLVNLLLAVPGIGGVCFWVLPLATTVFWFFLARGYARTSWNALSSVLLGNAVGILSLLVYLWQFVLETDATRNTGLAVASQLFSAAVPTYLFGRLIILFEPQSGYIGRTSMITMQVIAVVYMIAVFVCGYIWEKRKNRVDDAPIVR